MLNIIFYFTDQQRFDTCGCYGQKLDITPNLDKLASEGVVFEQAISPQPVCGPCRAIFQTGQYATTTNCFRNNKMLPHNVKTLANYLEEGGYETAYIGKWHLASEGELEQKPVIDHATTAVPKEFRGGYSGFWRVSDVLEFTSHGYDGYIFDENNKRLDFKGYRADCIMDYALEFFDKYDRKKPFFMTISQIEPHHQNDRKHYEGPIGSKEKYKNFTLPTDLEVLGGNAKEEYPDYLGQCASLDYNLGRLVQRLKDENLFDNTVIIFASDHGSHFMTRNKDEHLNGYDDYKRTCHDSAVHVPLVIAGGPFKGGVRFSDVVCTDSLPKTILALANIDVGDKMIGENLLDVISSKKEREAEAFIQISESRLGRAIRTNEYCYSVYAPNIGGGDKGTSTYYRDDFLYDLRKDPFELNNLIKDANYKKIKEMLRKKLQKRILEAEGLDVTIED